MIERGSGMTTTFVLAHVGILVFIIVLVLWSSLPLPIQSRLPKVTPTTTPSTLADPAVSGQLMPDISAARTNPTPTPNLTPTRKITKSYYLRNRNGTLALIRSMNGVKYVIRIEEFSGEEMPTLTAVTPPG